MMQQGLTIDYLNRLHNDLSKEQVHLVEEMKRTSTIEKEKSLHSANYDAKSTNFTSIKV